MSLIQLLKFKTWETRLSKMPSLEMGTRITVAYWYALFHTTKCEKLLYQTILASYQTNLELVLDIVAWFSKLSSSVNWSCLHLADSLLRDALCKLRFYLLLSSRTSFFKFKIKFLHAINSSHTLVGIPEHFLSFHWMSLYDIILSLQDVHFFWENIACQRSGFLK